jgi:uncharacterized membrane protein
VNVARQPALATQRAIVAAVGGLLTALAFVSVTLAWIAVHTVWALRDARLYYSSLLAIPVAAAAAILLLDWSNHRRARASAA